jgi:hypothetical protein
MLIVGQVSAVIAAGWRQADLGKRNGPASRSFRVARGRPLVENSLRTELGMRRMHLVSTIVAAVVASSAVASRPALAQDAFPSKPIKIVLPIPPGSALDVVTRVIGDQLGQKLGQQVLVEPRPGAGGLLAAQAVAAAPADGYTLLGGASSIFTSCPGRRTTSRSTSVVTSPRSE